MSELDDLKAQELTTALEKSILTTCYQGWPNLAEGAAAELATIKKVEHDKDMEIIRLRSISNSLLEYLRHTLPRIHGSDTNTEFCHKVHDFIDDLVL